MEPGVSFSDQLGGKAPDSITGNPAAENELPGTALAGRLLHLPEDSGLRLGGLWLVDTNGLISGGAQPGKWSWNSALIIGANFDAEKLLDWKGASFGIQFLQFNGQNTNGQAGSVQGYKRMFEKSQANARRLRIRRVAAMSISVSEVCTLYS
jgi:carbohydrate-selective porin OprB